MVTGHLAERLAGTLLSPNRGLLVSSPVLLFALAGMAVRLRPAPPSAIDPWLASIGLLHWVTVSAFESWRGGHSSGPRLLAHALPYLAYLLAHALAAVRTLSPRRGIVASAAFGIVVAMSVAIHAHGATSRHGDLRNAEPVDVVVRPDRLWGRRDLQLVRGRRRSRAGSLVSLGRGP